MDRNTIIGFLLIFGIIIAWQQFMQPSKKELAEQKRIQDSLALVEKQADSLIQTPPDTSQILVDSARQLSDSAKVAQLGGQYGVFAPAAIGEEAFFTLENDLLRVKFSSKGARIVEAEVKSYQKVQEGEKNKEIKTALLLLEDSKNRFDYTLPASGAPNGSVNSSDLFFTVEQTENAIVFRAPAAGGGFFEQRYEIRPDNYELAYALRLEGVNTAGPSLALNWVNYLDKLEKNVSYERNYSTVYYKPGEETPDHCSCTRSDLDELPNTAIKWVSHANQFFNSTLIAKGNFASGSFLTEIPGDESEDLKKVASTIQVPVQPGQPTEMTWYIGPNEFKRLHAYNLDLEDIIPFGSSIFGTLNRWVVRPIFTFLSGFIGSAGIVILMLTFVVKMLLYPLTYKMIYSQSRMGALKPHLAALKDKYKDDPQKQQVETMKVYQEFGVNPFSGCLPVVVQMPIWFALYRFFPASIEFRQVPFLWATDLSSYDVAFSLPFNVPFYGDHVSLFTILWTLTSLLYAYYSTQSMDFSSNPAMKYMQYIMPVMFMFFFNTFAAGLTCYLLFSNLLNVGQTIVTKNYIIDQNKILAELERNKLKPKKKGGFQARLQDAMSQQQEKLKQQQAAQNKKPNKK